MAGTFEPFAEDAAGLTIGGLTVENGTGRVSLSGSLDLARDRRSLDQAKALRAALDCIIAALEEGDLPVRAEAPKPVAATRKPNPFV